MQTFTDIFAARRAAEAWRADYNEVRPQRSDYRRRAEFAVRLKTIQPHKYPRPELALHVTGKPTDNAFVESFNASVRKELLNTSWFDTLEDVRRAALATRVQRGSTASIAGQPNAGSVCPVSKNSDLGGESHNARWRNEWVKSNSDLGGESHNARWRNEWVKSTFEAGPRDSTYQRRHSRGYRQ